VFPLAGLFLLPQSCRDSHPLAAAGEARMSDMAVTIIAFGFVCAAAAIFAVAWVVLN
jgi:hypothetical protein